MAGSAAESLIINALVVDNANFARLRDHGSSDEDTSDIAAIAAFYLIGSDDVHVGRSRA